MVKLVQEYFQESARKFPQKIAVNFQNKNITFSELDRLSNQLTHALKAKGVKRQDRVCFCLKKSINSLNAILGILKADAIYVPLDAKAPAARLKAVVEDATPRLIICDKETKELVKDRGIIFNLDEQADLVSAMPTSEPPYDNQDSDLAYILYTSGSTGKPKGVMISHANIINATEWAVEEFEISSEDRMSQHPPLHFDLSTFDVYCAFKAGATLFLVPEELSLFPGPLIKFIEEKKLTIWNSVPSVMVYLSISGLVKSNRIPTVKKVFFNGEAFPTKFLIEWMKTYPDKMFVNMYGPTETTVQCTFYVIDEIPKDPTRLVPIGKACRGAEIFAVKEDDSQVEAGETGELYVGGLGVGAGYWNDSEKTKTAFISWPGKGRIYKTGDLVQLLEDGNYEFLGRKDNQVKVMGHRIELGDIESALYSLPHIKEAGVIASTVAETGGTEVIAFVSLKENHSQQQLKNDLAKILPPHMIPHTIEIKDVLPRTNSGKVDRVTLKREYEH